MVLVAPAVSADTLCHFDIPAQSLNDALLRYANQAHIQLLFSADMVRGFSSKTLQGDLEPTQALELLLKNSGLSYRFIDPATATLLEQQSQIDAPSRATEVTLMDSLTVTATRPVKALTNLASPVDVVGQEAGYRVTTIASATRIDTPIKEIPQSIQTINRQLIDDQQTLFLSDALNNVSGVVSRSLLFSPVIEGTLVRGFRAEQLIDGFTQYYNPGDRESTVNVERVEVLKGANGIFYSGGSGSPVGGVINVVSKLPQREASREIGFTAGSYNFYQPHFDLNQPLNDNILFRVTAQYTDSENPIDDIHTERYNINPSLVLTDNENTTLTLQGKVSHWAQPEYQGLPATGTIAGSFRVPRDLYIGRSDIPDSTSESQAVWAKLEHHINRIWSMDLRARYSNSSFDEKIQTLFNGTFVADTPLLAPSTWALVNGELAQQQQEFSYIANAIASFDFGITHNTVLFGGDYSKLKDDGFVEAAGPIGLVDLSKPSFPVAYSDPGVGAYNQFVANTVYGGYLQWQSTIAKGLHTLLSLRLGGLEIAYDDKVVKHSNTTTRLELLPRLGAVYDVTDQLSLFAGYSEGMRGQPFVNFDSAPVPEMSQQMETGFKFEFANRLSGQVAVYQIDRQQVAVPNTGVGLFYTSSGYQRSQGIETDLLWQFSDEFQVVANYAHTNARFMLDSGGIAKGNRVAWVPEDAGRLWVNYRFKNELLTGVSLGVGVNLRSGSYIAHDNAFKVNGYHSFDATAAYEMQGLRLALTAKNLTDNDYFQPFQYFGGGYIGGGRVVPSAGASLYFSAALRF
ncbi:TonB-dependent receptor [Methylomonas sp. EbA]|uniref:TonB-dependent receptor n=2 Tax=Methylomonas albis TaxID=1854563 RepID=A0ABR9D6Y4_9GAMM|nr:TonB-dependent receptor [Methylomonas albis]